MVLSVGVIQTRKNTLNMLKALKTSSGQITSWFFPEAMATAARPSMNSSAPNPWASA